MHFVFGRIIYTDITLITQLYLGYYSRTNEMSTTPCKAQFDSSMVQGRLMNCSLTGCRQLCALLWIPHAPIYL